MGNELVCKLRCDGRSYFGKALLETSEILFRGDTRLKIAISSIKAIQAKDGELHVRTSDGLVVLELGESAEKWLKKIVNPKSRIEKLGVKPGESVTLEGKFSRDFLDDLKNQGATIARAKTTLRTPWIFLAAEALQDLRRVGAIARAMQGAMALWVVYPKGQKSVTESDVRSAGLKSGLTDIKVASFSGTHTALKFVIPKAKR